MNLCVFRLPCAAALLWLLAPAYVQAQRDPGGPGMGEQQSTAPSARDPGGPGTDGNASDFSRRADLALLPELRLGGQTSRWGGRVRLEATSALRSARGRCVFALQFEVVNGGLAASAATTHSVGQSPQIRLVALPRPERSEAIDLAQAPLAPGTRQRFRTQIELEDGSSWLEVRLDTAERVAESIEANNQRRVQIDLDGHCG